MIARACLLDGEPLHEGAHPLHELSVLLGDSVFETLRAYDGRPFALNEHIARLERSAGWARLRIGAPSDVVASEASAVARTVGGDSAVRIFVLRGEREPSARLSTAATRRLVVAEPLAVWPADCELGIAVCVLADADFGTREVAHAKYARYLPRLLARDEALARGAADALLADEAGRILSAATASVFAVVGGVVVTSSVLEGITRKVVVELAREMSLSVSLRPIERADVAHATEMFLTSSLREIVPVIRVSDQTIGSGSPGPVTRELQSAFRRLTRVT